MAACHTLVLLTFIIWPPGGWPAGEAEAKATGAATL